MDECRGQTSRGKSTSTADLQLVSIAVPAMEPSSNKADETSNTRRVNSQQICGGTMVPLLDHGRNDDFNLTTYPANMACDRRITLRLIVRSMVRYLSHLTSPHLTPHLGKSSLLRYCPFFQRAPTPRLKVKADSLKSGPVTNDIAYGMRPT